MIFIKCYLLFDKTELPRSDCCNYPLWCSLYNLLMAWLPGNTPIPKQPKGNSTCSADKIAHKHKGRCHTIWRKILSEKLAELPPKSHFNSWKNSPRSRAQPYYTLPENGHFQWFGVQKNGSSVARIKKLFDINYTQKWWIRHLFHMNITIGWDFRKLPI